MNRVIVAVFDTETQAFEGLTAIKELNDHGDISLYASAVINKNENGNIALREDQDMGPVGTAVGMLAGGFVGLVGGPAGLAIGTFAGGMGGLLYDLDKKGVDATFVNDVAQALDEGKTAIIADIDEGWNAPLDTRIAELDGMLFRKNRGEVEDEQLLREAEALNEEIEELEQDLIDANEDAKASINKQIAKAKEKANKLEELVEKKTTEVKGELNAKTQALEDQIDEASERKKQKLEKRKAELKAKKEASLDRLSKANKKLKQYVI